MSSVVDPSTCTTVPSRSVPPGSTDSNAGCVGTAFESSRVACIRGCGPAAPRRAPDGRGGGEGAVMVIPQFRTYVRIRQVGWMPTVGVHTPATGGIVASPTRRTASAIADADAASGRKREKAGSHGSGLLAQRVREGGLEPPRPLGH